MKFEPLPGSFMLISILGFLISAFYVFGLSATWGFTFALVFTLMFVASMISLFKADAEDQLEMDSDIFETETEREVSRKEVERMTKAEIKEYASEFGIELSTNDLKDEMIEQFFDELQ